MLFPIFALGEMLIDFLQQFFKKKLNYRKFVSQEK